MGSVLVRLVETLCKTWGWKQKVPVFSRSAFLRVSQNVENRAEICARKQAVELILVGGALRRLTELPVRGSHPVFATHCAIINL
jgi:hypothetical protein